MTENQEFLAYRSLLDGRADEPAAIEIAAARRILGSIPTPVFVKDKESRFVACNQAFADYAGIDPAQIVGLTDNDMPWGRLEGGSYVDWDRRVLISGMTATQIEEPIRTADGSIRWLEMNKVPLRDSDGSVIGIVGSFWDITERRKLQARMREIATDVSATTNYEDLKLVVCGAIRKLLRVDLAALMSVDSAGEFSLAHIDVTPGYDTSIDPERGVDFSWLSELLEEGTLNGATCSSGMGNHLGRALSTLACAVVVKGRTVGLLLVESRSLNLLGPNAASRLEGLASLTASKFEELRRSNEENRAAALSERLRIGEELHDTAIQALSSAALLTSAATAQVDPEDPVFTVLKQIQLAVDTSQGAMRSLILEPDALRSRDEPFIELLEDSISKFSVRSSISVVARLESVSLSPEETVVFKRIAEEALNNVHRHAKAKNVLITLSADPNPVLTISDDGKGYDQSADSLGHFGLGIMQSRAEKVGATLSITSKLGSGTAVRASLGPLPAEPVLNKTPRRPKRPTPKLRAATPAPPSAGQGPYWWLAVVVIALVGCYGLSVAHARASDSAKESTELLREGQVATERALIVRAQLDELTLALAAPLRSDPNNELAQAQAETTETLRQAKLRLRELAGGDGQSANEARLLLEILESSTEAMEAPRSADLLYGLSGDLQFSGVPAPGQSLTVLESITATLWLDQSVTFIAEESLMAMFDPESNADQSDSQSALVHDFISDAQSVIESDGGWLGPDPTQPLVGGVIELEPSNEHEAATVAELNQLLANTTFWQQDQWIRDWPTERPSPLLTADDLLREERATVARMREITDGRLEQFLSETRQQASASRRLAIGLRVALLQLILVVVAAAVKTTQEALCRLRELRISSRTDHLTGAWNRKALDTLSAELLAHRPDQHVVVVSTDMDRFKMVNDSYGHAFGDHILRLVATNLGDMQNLDLGQTTVVRLGGDEFVVCVQSDGPADLDALKNALNDLRNSRVSATDGALVAVGFSYGIALAKGPCVLEDLLNISDLGAYQDKAARLLAARPQVRKPIEREDTEIRDTRRI